MPLQKVILDIKAADGLGQKFDPRSLPLGKSARAENLLKNKAGRLEKRLGLAPLPVTDPYGSGFSLSTGVNLGVWNDGDSQGDDLLVIGRGTRPTTTSVATALQVVSDDLGGMLLRGPVPDIKIVSDGPTCASQGSVVSPCSAVSGDIMVSVWVDTSADLALSVLGQSMLAQPPCPQVGQIMWCAKELSTGNMLAGPAPVDVVVGQYTQFCRVDIVGATFIVCYSCATPPSFSPSSVGVIYAKTIAMSALQSGSGSLPDWTPNFATVGTTLVSNNAGGNYSPQYNPGSTNLAIGGGAFDMRAAGGADVTNFVLAYASGTYNSGNNTWSAISVTVDRRDISNPTAPNQWSVNGAAQQPSAFGVRCNQATGHVVVAWALPVTPATDHSYTVLAAVGSYPSMVSFNSAATIYTSVGPEETPPTWLDVAYCGQVQGHETYVESHSPSGACWNPAFKQVGGAGATATAVIETYLTGVVISGGGTNYPTDRLVTVTFTGGTFSRAAKGSCTVGGVGIGFAITTITVTDPGEYTAGAGPTGVTVDDPTGNNGTGSGLTLSSYVTQTGVLHITVVQAGLGYDQTNPPAVTITGGAGSGASFRAVVDSTGAISGYEPVGVPWTPNPGPIGSWGSGYTSAPTVTIAPANYLVGLLQSDKNRVGQALDSQPVAWWYPQNSARIIQNHFLLNASSNPVLHWTNTCGTTSNRTGAYSCITPGVTLASRGFESNGIVYYLGWVPSETQGSFIVLAFDLAQNPITVAGLVGNGFPMRPVGNLQTRTALADPGWGFQVNPRPPPTSAVLPGGYNFQTTCAPNGWTGGSLWFASGDSYVTAYVGYVSSSQGARLSPAFGAIQMQPRQGYPTDTWGDLTAIGGALPSLFDGQNVFEQGFLYTPESVVCTPVLGGGLVWNNITDAYSWIFTWEHFDAQGNFHISARANVTVTGADLLGLQPFNPVSGGLGSVIASLGGGVKWTGGMAFRVPTLGVTNRAWPFNAGTTQGITGPFGNDLRAISPAPSAPIVLGTYRTQLNGRIYRRVYDRTFNRDDIGDAGFVLLPPPVNGFVQSYDSTFGDQNQIIGWLGVIDLLADSILTGAVVPFPELYGDGTNGLPGNLDNFCPPATGVQVRHKDRLFVARGNQVLFSKPRPDGQGPGYNEVSLAFFVGGDDPVVGLASMDQNLIILKGGQNYYVTGDGPTDDGNGQAFGSPQPIPTDAGCSQPGSIKATPEGVYYMSMAGLRLIDRNLQVKYVGGPVEDELAGTATTSPYGVITGAALYPSANRLLFCANNSDVPVGSNAGPGGPAELVGEVLTRDYYLDAWTTGFVRQRNVNGDTGQVTTWQVGFIAAAVAQAFGGAGFGQGFIKPTLHFLAADGVVWRERFPLDSNAYYDNTTYVQWTWLTPMIVPPGDATRSASQQARFRLWDINALLSPQDAHGLVINVAIDYGVLNANRTWVWNSATGAPSIAPGGTMVTPLEQVGTYDGRMGEAFQVQIQDRSDPATTNGQGAQVLGLTCSLGVYQGPYRLPASASQ